jgi:pyruvate dehydrogenase E2 component (dihydrolipoamide acetyltransferase)
MNREEKNMAEQVLMIALSPTMDTGTVVKWNKKEGDKVESGDVLCEVETDKAAMDYESMSEGTLLKILAREGDSVAVGEVIAIIGEEGENIDHLLPSNQEKKVVEQVGDSSQDLDKGGHGGDSSQIFKSEDGSTADTIRVKSSPLARKIAEMYNVPLNKIKGSGPEGRIIKADVEKYLASVSHDVDQQEAKTGVAPAPRPAVSSQTVVQPSLSDEVISVSTKRRIIAQRLSESKFSAPHYYLTVSVAVDNLIQHRKSLNESLQDKVSFNAFIIKYSAEALKKHPMVNATWQGESILRHKNADIGLAVAQSDGLITPIVRDCGNKGLLDIDKELRVLIEKARNNSLLPEEYQGATFTITNLGSYGIEEFTAVINPPGSAILAIGEMKKVPIVDENNNIVVQTQMKLTLSCDHRVIDGAVGAVFLKNLKDIIEDPVRALY